MLTIMIKVNAPAGQAIGIKEHLAMVLEKFGDTQVVSIQDDTAQSRGEQMGLFGSQRGRSANDENGR